MARDARTALQELTAKLATDTTMTDDDVASIHDAAVARANRILEDRDWAAKAHVHDVPHVPVVTLDPEALAAYQAAPEQEDDPVRPGRQRPVAPERRVPELVDGSGVVCHDCHRGLVSDAGTTPLLVCPTVHGRRPRDMVPTVPGGAVECGRVREDEL